MSNLKETMNTSALIPVFTGNINDDTVKLVNARDLHKFLESKQEFSNWIKDRIQQYDFSQGIDFVVIDNFINDATQDYQGGAK